MDLIQTQLHKAYRTLFWNVPAAHKAYLKARKFDVSMQGKKLVIQGFPRSANTFLQYLIENAAIDEPELFTHLHSPAVFRFALDAGVPVLMPVRAPMGSVVSLMQYKNWSARRALDHYSAYYTASRPYLDDITVAGFSRITADAPAVLSLVERISEIRFKPVDQSSAAETAMEAMTQTQKSGHDANAGWGNRPDPARDAEKGAIKTRLTTSYAKDLADCDRLYAIFAERCALAL